MPFYGTQQWDPKLILAQIAALQSLSYLSLGLLLRMFQGMFGTDFTMDELFDYSVVDASSSTGWIIILATLLNALNSAVFLSFIVERAKKCLDFTFTSHCIHLAACTWYASFPGNWEWWMLNISSLIVMAVFGEYLCMRRELREIRISDFLSVRSPGSSV